MCGVGVCVYLVMKEPVKGLSGGVCVGVMCVWCGCVCIPCHEGASEGLVLLWRV